MILFIVEDIYVELDLEQLYSLIKKGIQNEEGSLGTSTVWGPSSLEYKTIILLYETSAKAFSYNWPLKALGNDVTGHDSNAQRVFCEGIGVNN